MKKSILIIGAGPGISLAVAKKFGAKGFQVGMISRNAGKLEHYVGELNKQEINAYFETADAGNPAELERAIQAIKIKLGGVDVLLYNAANLRQQDILGDHAVELTKDFTINVAGALTAVQCVLSELREVKGAVLFTGGGFSIYPSPQYGSISIGKAGLRSLAFQLNESLAPEGVYVGTLMVKGFVDEANPSFNSSSIAEQLQTLYETRSNVEIEF